MLSMPKRKRKIGYSEGKKFHIPKRKQVSWVQEGKKESYTQKKKGNGAGRKDTEYGSL